MPRRVVNSEVVVKIRRVRKTGRTSGTSGSDGRVET
jgi:hypothetical protein